MAQQIPWAAAYGKGVPLRLDYGDDTLVDQFEAAVRRYPSRPAIDFMGQVTSYRDLGRAVERVAGALAELGVVHGDRVAILLPSCPANVIATQAIMRLGAVAVQHNPLYTADELAGPFADHGARVAICWQSIASTVLQAAGGSQIEHVICVDLVDELPRAKRMALRLPVPQARKARRKLTAPAPKGVTPWKTLLKHAPLEHGAEQSGSEQSGIKRPVAGDAAIMLYTSGTSGTPKGVPLTHANLVANCLQGKAWAQLRDGEEIFLAVLPMFHAYGLTISVLAGINLGACLVMLPAPEIDLIMDAFQRRLPTFAPAVPPLYARILDEAAARNLSLEGIRVGLSGAMSLSAELVERWERATGGHLIEGYGLTETSPVVIGNPISPSRRVGTIGVPFPDVDIRLVDPEDVTEPAPSGGPGELLVRGPQVFGGYFNKPTETEQAFSDGYFRTGDIVEIDDDGFLTVVDRLKELIITGGFNVYPSEVEEVLRTHPHVEDAAVVGLPAKNGGEDVVAAIVTTGATPDVDELRGHVKKHLAAYKAPRRFYPVDELPKNPMGKVLRREVATLVREASERETGKRQTTEHTKQSHEGK